LYVLIHIRIRIELSMANVFGAPKYLALAFKILVILALSSLFQIAAARYVSLSVCTKECMLLDSCGRAGQENPPRRRSGLKISYYAVL
jgi:hypothetical protein